MQSMSLPLLKTTDWFLPIHFCLLLLLCVAMGCTNETQTDSSFPEPSGTVLITPHLKKPPPLPPLIESEAGHLRDMHRGLDALKGKEARENFERGFRLTFSSDKAQRDYTAAKPLLTKTLDLAPKHPQSLRALGYVAVNQGFQLKNALLYYLSAIRADPEYGDAHYALAFLYGSSDPEKGMVHFQKATTLGVKDTRNLAKKFYGKKREEAEDLNKEDTP